MDELLQREYDPGEGPLSPDDYRALAARWIRPADADAAGLYRVDATRGCEIVGRKRCDVAGIVIPFFRPGTANLSCVRIRRDHPDIERKPDGGTVELRKYLTAPGAGNRLYFPPGLTEAHLADTTLKLLITEGEFKALALNRLACHMSEARRFVSVGVTGVYNWRGKIGKVKGPKGENLDEKGPISDLDLIAWKDRPVLLVYDADAETNPSVKRARWQFAHELQRRGAKVGYLRWPAADGKGIDDRLAKIGPDPVLAEIEACTLNPIAGWRVDLIRSDAGKAKPLLENACLVLENDESVAGCFGFDQFANRAVALKTPPWGFPLAGEAWTDAADLEVVRFLQRQGIEVGKEVAGQAVQAVATRHAFNPLRDYLDGLRWDGEPRVDGWLSTYVGVERNNYSLAVGRCWLISAVARAMRPGCQVDHVLILEGEQGDGKSQVCRILGGTWYRDFQFKNDVFDKDSALKLSGAWILEIAELEALKRSSVASMKAFLTSTQDSYRPPYGKRTEDVLRACVFIGTVNEHEYLKDSTGDRRYWPVRVQRALDLEGLKRDRDQLWAEALALFQDGEVWWLNDPTLREAAKEQQSLRFEEDAWTAPISKYLDTSTDTSVDEVLTLGLKIELARQDGAARARVGRILAALKWSRYRGPKGSDGKRLWRYSREMPVSSPAE